MKRLLEEKGFGRRLRLAVIAIAAAAGVLVLAPGASAVPSAAPEITAQPSNPNTTQGKVTFSYKIGAGETQPAPVRFYCRQYPTATPPTSWLACGITTVGDPTAVFSRTYSPALNGSQTFEVAGRQTTAIGTQGPIATYVWDHNLAVPAQAPALTAQPSDPTTNTVNNKFTFTGGTGETELPSLYQCSLDGGTFTQCNSGEVTYTPGNGDHSFEVRAGTPAGYGPSTTYEWTNEIPNPEPNVRVADEATTVYTGGKDNANIGRSLVNLGDVNGDGLDDLGSASYGGDNSDPGIYIQFSTSTGRGTTSVMNTPAEYGYRIVPFLGNVVSVHNAGDQNGDGTPDQLIDADTGTFVVYGVKDPTTLPVCASGAPARCLDPTTITSDQGYELVDSESLGFGQGNDVITMNFDGSGPLDLVFAAGSVPQIIVVKGGARTGPVDIGTLTAADRLTVTNVSGGQTVLSRVDDINADGRDDLSVGDVIGGANRVLYGFDWDTATFDLATMTPAQGISLAGVPFGTVFSSNAGDLNGDGRDDLAVASASVSDANGTQSFLYLPEPGTPGTLKLGAAIEPGNGYYATGGVLPSEFRTPATSIGDFNGDGLEDMIRTASQTPVDGDPAMGAAYIVFGQATAPEGLRLGLGPDLTPSAGVALLGSSANGVAGVSSVSMGDLDGDGLAEVAYGALGADAGFNDAGSISIVPGKSMINQTKTGNAVGITDKSASINGSVSTNGRDSTAHFEYGKTDEYGQKTADQELEGSGSGSPVDAELTGLEKETQYHYRVVSTNSLGITRYGEDKVFTTKSEGTDGDPCTEDQTKPGCAGWCKAHPEECRDTAVLTKLVVNPKTLKVKRGKKGTVTTVLTNVGGKPAEKVKICVKAPKKLVKVKRCKTIGKISPKATKVTSLTVTVKKKAKKGKKINLALKATSGNAGSKSGKATIRVK